MYSLTDIEKIPDVQFIPTGNLDVKFANVKSILDADLESLVWVKDGTGQEENLVKNTKASVIVCKKYDFIVENQFQEKLFLFTENPKLLFIKIAEYFFGKKHRTGIHESAIISPDTKIGENVYIGPNVILDDCQIGDDVNIYGNVYIFSKTEIGNRVSINPGTVIGADGFGYSRNSKNELEKFPHFGGVIIGDDVEIGSNTSIDRGTLGNTIIEDGVKIDNLVHIAHNVVIGKHSMIIANSMIGGSTKIGAYSWIAPSVNLMNQIVIGENVTIGMGSVVTKNVPDNETWTGIPAKEFKEFLELQKKLKNL